MSCHAILKNLYQPKMDVIWTISFKTTAEIEIRKHTCFANHFADEVFRLCEAYIISFIHSHEMHLHCFLLLSIALLMLMPFPAEVHQCYVISLSGVGVR